MYKKERVSEKPEAEPSEEEEKTHKMKEQKEKTERKLRKETIPAGEQEGSLSGLRNVRLLRTDTRGAQRGVARRTQQVVALRATTDPSPALTGRIQTAE